VVVYGFDPLTPEVQIRTLLGSFGEIAEFDNKKDDAGSYVGVCSVLYKDSIAARKQTVKAAEAARRAEKEGTGQKIGVCTVTIERDPEGTRARRQVTKIIKAQLMEQERLLQEELSRKRATASSRQSAPRAPPVRPPPPIVIPKTPLPVVKSETPVNRAGTPPPNAPTGPAAKIAPFIPRTRHPEHSLVEQDPILPSLRRIPYIFISHESVPVLGTTIAHLKKRLRLYDWREVRCDPTGYYVVFEDSKRGEDETLRCYKECHMHPLFTYFMQMECHQYGNPNYVRSPSPERVAAEKRAAADRKRLREEDEADWQMERKERAQNLDLSIGVLDLLLPRLRDIILKDLKQKLATPALHDYLAPEKHTEKRRRYGIADPNAAPQQASFQFTRDETPSVGTPNSRASFQAIFFKNKSLTFDKKGRPVPRKEDPSRLAPVNAFDDERRKKRPTKPRVVHALHRRMLEFEDSDSEDEKQTTFTRSDDQDSRAVSEVAPSPARVADEDGSATPKKRRKLENGWAGTVESDDEIDVHSKSLLGHLLGKEPEDMAMRELHQVISTLPRHTKLRKRALAEVKLRKKAEEDDALFFGINKIKATEVAPMTDLVADDELSTATPEPETQIKATKKKGTVQVVIHVRKILTFTTGTAKPVEAKPKKKTKKQILEEQEVAREEAKATENLLVEIEKEEAPTPEVLEPQEEEPRAEVEWSVSTERPRRTVEDDPELVLDIDGWQHLVKDDEDVRFLSAALHSHRMTNLGDVKLWAWTQKEIKALNNGGVYGAVNKPITIDGYYVSNATGCARTEGVKKILNSEKSKYLPHHIRVRKQREAREEQAKKDPTASAAELAKQVAAAKMASVQTSRSARANNRRLVNEIATQKQTLGLESDAMSFNQLKKRKKLVRFDRSAIHNWGLYADENIAAGDMIIEYVGELVRQRVADLREIKYQLQGIGSSYLFRIDEDLVVDATKKGGIARFINHSCAPSCTAKIIKVEGTKRIVIYALRDIAKSKFCYLYTCTVANSIHRRGTHLRLQIRARNRLQGPHSLPLRLRRLQGLPQLISALPFCPFHTMHLHPTSSATSPTLTTRRHPSHPQNTSPLF